MIATNSICLIFLSIFLIGGNAQSCYDAIKAECASGQYAPVCSASYGNFKSVVSKFQLYTNNRLAHSWHALLVAKQFANYEFARPGFHNLFMTYSDTLFESTINFIRYINQRGSTHDFKPCSVPPIECNPMFEFESTALITDIAKSLAIDASDIDTLVGGPDTRYHDADSSYQLKTNYVRLNRKHVRDFAGYNVRLAKMLNPENQKLALFDFDDWLQTLY